MEAHGQQKNYDQLLMESFVELSAKFAKDQGLGQAEFARLVWPESSPRVASYRWQSMRTKVRNTGKPQGVLISDAQRMSVVLNQDLAYMFLLAKDLASKKAEAALKGEKKASNHDKARKSQKAAATAKKAKTAQK